MKEKFTVLGMTCSACSAGIERTVKKLEGVLSVEVSLMGEMMTVEYDEKKLQKERIINAVVQLGYGALPYDENALNKKKSQPNKLKRRFFVSLFFLLPLMYFSMGGMMGLPTPPTWLNNTLQMILSLVVIVVNFKFYTSGTKALIKKVPNMDTLVALGSAASFVYSLVLTVIGYIGHSGHGHLFYESAAMILVLVTLGKWLEENSKRKTGDEVEKLIKLMPNTVVVERNGFQSSIAFSEIEKGDILIVKQGDYIPVDGVVLEGHAFLDRAAITGESMPVEVVEGDSATGADIVKSGYLKILAQKVGVETTLSQIVKMVKEAGASKAPIQKTADKIAGIFVPVVALISLITFFSWLAIGSAFSTAANYAISVLVISCPCSLGLATPVAVMAATGRGMSLGVLYKDAEALQKAKEINCALLDKTATLTVGKPTVNEFICLYGQVEQALNVAYAMEEKSNHPIAECIKDYANEKTQINSVLSQNYRYETGKGGVAEINGITYYLGNLRLLPKPLQKNAQEQEKKFSQDGKTVVFLAKEDTLVALFTVADTLKETSQEGVNALKARGVRTAMLTGDSENVAKAIAQKVGIDEYFAEALPNDKAEAVKRVRSVGGIVAMIGDGINDSPALKEADIGVAMGTGTDIAIDSADVVFVRGDLKSASVMIDLSKATVKNIKQNLFWAFFYNCVAIPIAAGVFATFGLTLNPMIAAACMSLSSLFVVFNALRLTKFGKEKKEKKINQKENNGMQKTIKIEGMMCMHCVAHVKKALTAIDGVKSVEVSLEEKIAVVDLEREVKNEVLTSAIVEAGYEVVSLL